MGGKERGNTVLDHKRQRDGTIRLTVELSLDTAIVTRIFLGQLGKINVFLIEK